MLTVKIMGPENLPDHDARKTFVLLTGVKSVEFSRREAYAVGDPPGDVHLNFAEPGDCTTYPARGNVYVMNDKGVTVSSFSPFPVD